MIIAALDREWTAQLAASPSPWTELPGTLDDVLLAIRDAADTTLLSLLTRFADGDALAGRVVVQTLLPKVRLLCCGSAGLDEDELVAHLWLGARTYPLRSRRGRVAANLVLDARKRLLKELGRDVPVGLEPPTPPVVATPEDTSAAEVLARAVRLRLVTPDTGALLDAVYRQGVPGREAARRHGITEPALRQRCSKAVRRMSGHRLALVA